MKRGALLSCFCLCLVFISVSAITNLTSINNLRQLTRFGRNYPQHGLMLLLWFSNNIRINQNGIQLNFKLTQGIYGSHHYCNSYDQSTNTKALPVLPNNRVYYSLGSLSKPNARGQFPEYVTQDFYNARSYSQRNLDRIVIDIPLRQMQTANDVYITQHYEERNQGSVYDPENTFRVMPSLLGEIQALIRNPFDGNSPMCSLSADQHCIFQKRFEKLRSTYPDEALAWLMTLAGYNPSNRLPPSCSYNDQIHNSFSFESKSNLKSKCEAVNRIQIEVKCAPKGYARITWSGIPENILKMKGYIGIYKEEQSPTIYPLSEKTFGSIDTSWYLNSGLQIKLTNVKNEILWIGPEFDAANGFLPTDVRDYDVSLQLFTKDGYASARLFIRESFYGWQTALSNSWVGFYQNPSDGANQYYTYQWSVNFEKNPNQQITEDYKIYEYQSKLPIGPGVHLHFLNDTDYTDERAHTEAWDCSLNT